MFGRAPQGLNLPPKSKEKGLCQKGPHRPVAKVPDSVCLTFRVLSLPKAHRFGLLQRQRNGHVVYRLSERRRARLTWLRRV